MNNDRISQKPLSDLEAWRAGEPLRERKLNQGVDALNELRRGFLGPRQVVAPPSGGKGTIEEQLVFVKTLAYDSIICLTNPADADSTLVVAKPYMLRRTPWQASSRPWMGPRIYGYAYNAPNMRTATRAGTEIHEIQVITPSYEKLDPLVVRRVTPNILWAQGSDELDGVEWMEWYSAREWAVQWSPGTPT
ncbi:MAG: hypothetical protein ACYTEX_26945 [Planctomycetota bacterium]|jgi:hypothetical protein